MPKRRRPESWKAIAEALGARLAYQANACPAGTFQPGEGQSPGGFVGEPGVRHDPDVEADTCPFCADTIAYRRFRARERGERYVPRTSPGGGDRG